MSKANTANAVAAKSSNTALLIIGAVLVVVLLGGWWFYASSSAGVATNSNSNGNTNTVANKNKDRIVVPPNAPPGAQPAHEAGSPSASVTLEEFADFQCPQCGNMYPVFNEIKSMYGTRIRFIFREYPLNIPAHDKSYDAAVAAEAAGMQGPEKFWAMQNMLFTNQRSWTANPTYKDIWKGYAQTIGLDVNKWETDMAGIAAKGRVDADLQRVKALAVNSTPTLYINNTQIPFESFDTVQKLKGLIDGELAKANPQQKSATETNTEPANK